MHQFCRVGRHAYVGGYSVVTMDALPFVKTVGQKPAFYGLNSIGLKRKGFDPESVRRLDQAMRILVRSRLNTAQALEQIRAELAGDPAGGLSGRLHRERASAGCTSPARGVARTGEASAE